MATDTRFSGFLDHDHQLPKVGVASSETVSNCAVTFCGSEALQSVSSTMTCVEWWTVADCRPGPVIWLVQDNW